jgi:hypothetical protein
MYPRYLEKIYQIVIVHSYIRKNQRIFEKWMVTRNPALLEVGGLSHYLGPVSTILFVVHFASIHSTGGFKIGSVIHRENLQENPIFDGKNHGFL